MTEREYKFFKDIKIGAMFWASGHYYKKTAPDMARSDDGFEYGFTWDTEVSIEKAGE